MRGPDHGDVLKFDICRTGVRFPSGPNIGLFNIDGEHTLTYTLARLFTNLLGLWNFWLF